MKNIKQFLAATLAVLCLAVAGCTKEDSGSVSDNAGSGNTGGGGGTQFDGKRLVKILYQRHEIRYEDGVVVKDTTYWQNKTTDYIWENDRLVRYNRENTIITIIYNNQNKPYKVSCIDDGSQYEGVYTYDEQGKLVLWQEYRDMELRRQYNITCNEAGEMIEYTFTNSDGNPEKYTVEWNNGNIEKTYGYINGSLYETNTYEYDNKRNPYIVFPFLFELPFYTWTQNNVTSSTDERNGEYQYTYQGDYTLTMTRQTGYGHGSNTGDVTFEEKTYTTEYYEYDDGTGHIDR